jgi:hypothetical protein
MQIKTVPEDKEEENVMVYLAHAKGKFGGETEKSQRSEKEKPEAGMIGS